VPDLAAADLRPDPLEELTAREALCVIEEEVQRLPESYRLPVVLCCLQGASQEEAARQLGCSPGSVKGRLERGRQRLHRRLAARGLGLGAALALVELSRGTAPAFMGALAETTARAALEYAARGPAGAGSLSAEVVALARAGLQPLSLAKAKLGLLLLAAVAAISGLVVAVPRGPVAERAQAAPDAQPPGSPGDEARARTDRYGDALPQGTVARLGTVRFRLGGWGEGVLFTLDGQRLVSRDGGGGLRLWEVSTGRPLGQLSLPGDQRAGPTALSADGKLLAVGGNDGAVYLLDLRTGKAVRRLVGPAEQASALAFSPDGKLLASGRDFDYPRKHGQDNPIQLWDVATGRELRRLVGHKDTVLSLAFSPDGKTLASGAERYDGTLRLWDVATGKERLSLKGHGEVRSVAFSPDGKEIATSGMDRTIRLWDPAIGRELRRLIGHQADVMAVAFSPDGRLLASGGFDRTLRLWDPGAGKQLRRIELDEAGNARTRTSASRFRINRGFAAVAFSPDSKTLAAAGRDHTLRLFDAATGDEVRPVPGQFDAVDAVAFSPDGGRVWTMAGDRNLRAWETATGKEARALESSAGLPLCVAFSANGKLAATGGEQDRAAHVWDLATGRELRRVVTTDVIGALALAPDGRTLATANRWSQPEVSVWDLETRRLRRRLPAPAEGGNNTVVALAFTPDGRTLAGPTHDGVVHFWDPAGGSESLPQLKLPQHCDLAAFSPDGRTLAVGNMNGAICLYEMATGKERLRCQGFPFCFSPDGRLLASGRGAAVAVWDLASGEVIGRLRGHRGDVAALAFSADGTRLVSGSQDTTALVWDLSVLRRPARPALTRERLAGLWRELAGADARAAYRAVGALAAAPEQAVPFLAGVVRPVPPADPKQVARLVADLDSEEFAVRERASADLGRLGEAAEPALREALTGEASLEVRRRVGEVLDRLRRWSPERLQTERTLEALERVGMPEARRVVAKLARESSGTWTGTAAREALRRLERRTRR
jgi:WD40 repeat protein